MPDTYRRLNMINRALFALWIIDEGYAFQKRKDPDRINMAADSPPAWALGLLLLPVIWPLRVPRSLRIFGLVLQLLGLVITVGARRQLIAVNSFGWSSQAATDPQQTGFYRHFEHPIYTSMLIQVLGLGAANPLILIAPVLGLGYVSRLISNERRFLETLGTVHRGIDSRGWDLAIAAANRQRI